MFCVNKTRQQIRLVVAPLRRRDGCQWQPWTSITIGYRVWAKEEEAKNISDAKRAASHVNFSGRKEEGEKEEEEEERAEEKEEGHELDGHATIQLLKSLK